MEVTTLLRRLDGYIYGSLKGHLSLTWKIGVCFVENRSLFSKNWIEKSKFALKNGSLKMGVCFRKWKFVFENRSLKVEVCFPKSELKIRICCRKSEIDVSDVGACSARVAWGLVPDCAEGSMFRHWRNGGQCWSNDDKLRKQPFWTWPKTRSKISKKRSAKEERKEGKQNAEPPVRL